jgi:hypothetical protein
MIDSPPQVAELAVDLHEHLIQMPTPLGEAAQTRNPVLSDLCREHRANPVPPKSDSLMADIDPALGQQILNVAQATAGTARTSLRPDGSLLASC